MFGETFRAGEGGGGGGEKRGVTRCIGQTGLSCKPLTKGFVSGVSPPPTPAKSLLSVSAKVPERLPLNLAKNRQIRGVAGFGAKVSFPQENNYVESINRVGFNPLTCFLLCQKIPPSLPLAEINSYLRLADTHCEMILSTSIACHC